MLARRVLKTLLDFADADTIKIFIAKLYIDLPIYLRVNANRAVTNDDCC